MPEIVVVSRLELHHASGHDPRPANGCCCRAPEGLRR